MTCKRMAVIDGHKVISSGWLADECYPEIWVAEGRLILWDETGGFLGSYPDEESLEEAYQEYLKVM